MSNEDMAILVIVIGFIISCVVVSIYTTTITYEIKISQMYKLANLKTREEIEKALLEINPDIAKQYMPRDEYLDIGSNMIKAFAKMLVIVTVILGIIIKAIVTVM